MNWWVHLFVTTGASSRPLYTVAGANSMGMIFYQYPTSTYAMVCAFVTSEQATIY